MAQVLRESPGFRRLWLGQVVSQIGDWFNHVAVTVLLLELKKDSPDVGGTLALTLILRMLPWLVIAPFAGVLIDRLDRKKIMIASDLLRGLFVPLYLLVDRPGMVPIVYGLTILQVVLASFFEPARSAVLPSLVSGPGLLSASALSSLTWSVVLAVGSGIGALAVHALGIKVAFLVDAISFFLSAWFVWRIDVPRTARAPIVGHPVRQGFVDLFEGLRYIVKDGAIASLVLVKSGIGLSAGILLLLNVFSDRVFPIDGKPELTIGILYAARGVGTAFGPFIGRAFTAYREASMRRVIGIGLFESALFWICFAYAPSLPWATVLLLLAHLGTSTGWVFSTVLLQMRVPDEFRGRVFSAELALFTSIFCIATFIVGRALDAHGDPRFLAAASGAMLLVPGVIWVSVRFARRGNVEPGA